MEYILENVIAERQVNLVAGASGSGKTRWIFQLKHEMEHQRKLLGYRTRQAVWGYLSGDRTGDSIRETLRTMGLGEMKVYSCVDHKKVGRDLISLWPEVCTALEIVPEFLVVDGFTSFCPDGEINAYAKVAKWLAGLQGFCESEGVTILGACHTSKAREGETILDPRQKIAGSVAWAAYTEGVVVIDRPFQGGPKDPWRDIYMCGRNAGLDIVRAQFNSDGWLELREGEKEKVSAVGVVLEHLLVPGAELRSKELEAAAKEAGVGRSTFYSWLSSAKERGELQEGGRGLVVVPWGETDVGKEMVQ